MRLQDRLPDSVKVGRKKYKLDLDFRNVLDMMDIMARDDLLPEARSYLALKCVLKRPPKECGIVLDEVRKLLFGASRPADGKRITDFQQDADLIRAAFRQVYGINLFTDKVHWLEFTVLLANLPEGNRYSEILGIRARPMPKATKYNMEERQWLAKAKAAYALKVNAEEAQENYQKGVHDLFLALKGMTKR